MAFALRYASVEAMSRLAIATRRRECDSGQNRAIRATGTAMKPAQAPYRVSLLVIPEAMTFTLNGLYEVLNSFGMHGHA